MPDDIGGFLTGAAPVMRDAGDTPQRVIGFGAFRIHLAHDRVFGARHIGKSGHGRADPIAAVEPADGFQMLRRVRQPQFRCVGE